MAHAPTSDEVNNKRRVFFNYVFGDNSGYVCVVRGDPETKAFLQHFFFWPDQADALHTFIERFQPTHNLWYAPFLFDSQERLKETVSVTPVAWADLDSCPPDKLLVPPTIVLESSPKRYQALWFFEGGTQVDPADAEEISRRIAYAHAEDGADKTGWDLTQLLRVPFTYNFKYDTPIYGPPLVRVISVNEDERYNTGSFSSYPQVEEVSGEAAPMPETFDKTAEEILEYYRSVLPEYVWKNYSTVPDASEKEKWSGALWRLEMSLAEHGLSREEIFVVARASACNKYKRDGKSDKLLWREVCKAYATHEERKSKVIPLETEPEAGQLLSTEERAFVERERTFVEDYVEWAKTLGDAAWQYHQAGAFVILSSLLAGSVRLPTSFGNVSPNLWFMILADTTLTRKTTAMDLAVDLLAEIDSDAVLATDGSIEGLFTSLSMRPGRPSIFLRDEFSGLLEAITKKDYYAGMAETLTKLYDGKFQKRVLRKEVIEVRDPRLIIFAGGIKSRTLGLLNQEHVASGFLPRFIFISAETDVSKLQPLGPPTTASLETREAILKQLRELAKHYQRQEAITVNGRTATQPHIYNARLTDAAWRRYNDFEARLVDLGLRSYSKDMLTPMMDRLAKSGLKAAVLLAAVRQRDAEVFVDEIDILRAFYYIEQWRDHSLDVVRNVGKTVQEKTLDLITKAIQKEPNIHRSTLMQRYHLLARDADVLLGTLEQRGVINRIREGRTERLVPVT